MLDFNDIVTNVKADRQVFEPSGVNWQTWVKPRGVNFVHIFCIGGGGGGRAGEVSGSGEAGIGGGGAATSTALFPAWALPNTLAIRVGAGGAGGTRGVNPTGGGASIIALWPSETTPTTNSILLRASGGNFSVGYTSGAAPVAAATVAVGNLVSLGLPRFVLGNGSSDQTVNTYSFAPTFPGQGGGRGGDPALTSNTAGGAAQPYEYGLGLPNNTFANIPVGQGGAAADGTAGNGTDGTDGFVLFPGLPYMTGGTGGGGAGRATLATANGGNGGNGGIGCGGGGGGGNFAGSFPGSRGGNGGPGLVIITSW